MPNVAYSAVLLLLLHTSNARSADRTDLSQLIKCLQALESKYKCYSAIYTVNTNERVTCDVSGDLHRSATNTEVYCGNEKYSFQVSRISREGIVEYKLLKYAFNGTPSPLHRMPPPSFAFADINAKASYATVLTRETARVEQVEHHCMFAGANCVRVRVSFLSEPQRQINDVYQDYYFWTDKDYLCAGITYTSAGIRSQDRFYYTDDVPPLPMRIETGLLAADGSFSKRREIKISQFVFSNNTDVIDNIRLSHYGLPEPEGVVWEKPIPAYVWYLSIAGGCAAIMFLCGWLLMRRAKARAAAATTSALPQPPGGSG